MTRDTKLTEEIRKELLDETMRNLGRDIGKELEDFLMESNDAM